MNHLDEFFELSHDASASSAAGIADLEKRGGRLKLELRGKRLGVQRDEGHALFSEATAETYRAIKGC